MITVPDAIRVSSFCGIRPPPHKKGSPITLNGKRFCGCCRCANPDGAKVLVFRPASPAVSSYPGCIEDNPQGLFRLGQQKPKQSLLGSGGPSSVCGCDRECAGPLLRWTPRWTLWPPLQGAAGALESPHLPQSRLPLWAPISLHYPLYPCSGVVPISVLGARIPGTAH